MTEPQQDNRFDFDAAAHYVQSNPGSAAFAAMPVFGERSDDAEQSAEGARVFLLEGDGAGAYRLRFIAGPFFANVHAANEIMSAAEIPQRVRELRFLPTRYEEDWLMDQVQLLIQKLMQASGQLAPHMPDYASAPQRAAGADVVMPISFVGRK